MIPALLVGSNAKWRDQIDGSLAAHGIAVRWWWPTKAKLGPIPVGCGAVIVTVDNCSHSLSKPAMERARDAGVPLVCGSHRRAAMSQTLTAQGFPRVAAPEPEVEPVPPSPCLPVPPSPVPALESPMPLHHDPAVATFQPRARVLYDAILPILAAAPFSAGPDVAKALTGNGVKAVESGALWRILAAARRTLGVNAKTGGSGAQISDRARYEAACVVLGVEPVADSVGPARPPGSRSGVPPKPRAARLPIEEAIAAVSPAPALPAPEPTLGFPATTVEAIKLLLEAMRAENVGEVSVTDDGAIRMSRRVTVLTTLKL